MHTSVPATLYPGCRNAPSANAEMATTGASQFAELAALGFFNPVAKADVDKALGDVLSGLRAVEGLEGSLVGHVSRGFASADFARLVEGAVKANLETETKGLIRARLMSKAAREVTRDEVDHFMANAAAAVEAALGLIYRAVHERWRATARVDEAGRKNYVHVDKELVDTLDVRKKDMVHYLCYEVGDVVYGGARADGVVVLVFLGGEKSIRVEVFAKSIAGLPVRFEEVEWGGERWLRLATAKIHNPSGSDKHVAQVELRLAKLEAEVDGGAASVEGLRGLLVSDASGKEIETPDPLLLKLFAHPFERVEIEVAGVSHTEAGFALTFRAVARDDKPFKELFNDIAERYGKELWFVVDEAKGMWLEAMRKLCEDIKRITDKAAEVGKREGVESGRKALVEGLKRLFEEKEREALDAGRSDEALAIAVAGRLLIGIVNSPREWLSLLVGDGVVDFVHKTLGFSAKYTEVAEAVLRLLATWAGAYGAKIRAIGKGAVVYASSRDAVRVLGAVLAGEVLEYAASLAKSWSGLAGSDAPKVISLLALAQLLGVVEERWAVELWLAHKAVTTPTQPEAAKALEGLFARVEGVDKVEWTKRGVSLYFKVRGVGGAERAAVFKLYTDFRHFLLYCESCSDEKSAKRVLGELAEELRPAVEQLERRLGLVAKEQKWPKWNWNALELPARVGWPMFLKLWIKVHDLSREEGGERASPHGGA